MPSQEREGLHAEAKKLHAEVDELRSARLDNENRLVETTSMAEDTVSLLSSLFVGQLADRH